MEMGRLLALQEIDTATARLSARKRMLEAGGELSAAREEADAAERDLGELGLQLDVIGRDQSKLEHEIDSITQKTAAEQKRLYDGSIVNAKELGALQHEIENLTRRRTDREDELLGLMEVREGLDARAVEARTRSEALRSRVAEVGGASLEELATIDEELVSRTGERETTALDIDADVLELYEDLRRQKKGIGAAALVDGVCQGCHEKLSAMELDKLKRSQDLKRCEYCRRILVS